MVPGRRNRVQRIDVPVAQLEMAPTVGADGDGRKSLVKRQLCLPPRPMVGRKSIAPYGQIWFLRVRDDIDHPGIVESLLVLQDGRFEYRFERSADLIVTRFYQCMMRED